MPQCQLQRVLLAPLLYRFFYGVGYTVEAVSRARTLYPLVRPPKIIVANRVLKPLGAVGEGRKDRFLEVFRPKRLPETFNLAQGHGVVWCTSHMPNSLPGQHLLEAAFAPPGNKLAAIVRQDLPGCAKVTDGSLHYLQYSVGLLLPEESVANDVA